MERSYGTKNLDDNEAAVYITGPTGKIIGHTGIAKFCKTAEEANAVTQANADMAIRIAACLNACEGIGTEVLEKLQRPLSDLLSDKQAIAVEQIEWLQKANGLHRQINILYVINGYEVTVTWDDNAISEDFHGRTLSEAISKAMAGHDLDVRHPFQDREFKYEHERQIDALAAQRNELLAALQSLVLFTNPKPSNAAALNNAHQAIAKAEFAVAPTAGPTIAERQRDDLLAALETIASTAKHSDMSTRLGLAQLAASAVAKAKSAEWSPAVWTTAKPGHGASCLIIGDHAPAAPDRYTSISKGGSYEKLGVIRGAGQLKGFAGIGYRDTATGDLFIREPECFAARMKLIPADGGAQ